MSSEKWCLPSGQSLSRLKLSDVVEKRFAQFEDHETMEDRVQYQFRNGFVDVGDLPCRKHFWNTMANRAVSPSDALDMESIYFANGKRRVELSGFRHYPIHSQCWASCTLHTLTDGNYPFKLSTCGGVRIWVDGQLNETFTPFDRNVEHSQNLELSLSKGENQLLIHFEELFERDTYYYFELTYLGQQELQYSLEGVDCPRLKALESYVSSLSSQLAVHNGCLQLESSEQAPEAMELTGTITGMSNEDEKTYTLSPYHLDKTVRSFSLPLPAEMPSAHYSVDVEFRQGDLSISRKFGINVLPTGKAPASKDIEERKRQALLYTAQKGMGRTGKLLAILETGENLAEASDILQSTLNKISMREDCSDFWLVSLLWCWKEHAWSQLTEKQWQRVRSSILGYRYWLDEPGNDSMWFWSENHVLCFHVSQLLAGQFFSNDTFICSGRKGAEQKALATERLNKWFAHVLEHGLAEWNSSCYFPIDYIGLFALYHLSDNQELQEKARTLLDRLMTMSAMHYQAGVASGTMGRVYEKELMASQMTEMAAFGHVAWGDGWNSRMCASLPMFCISDYVPPESTIQVAHLQDVQAVEAKYTQGIERCAKIVAWKQKDVTLSSVVDHHTGKSGHQQHVVDVQLGGNPEARLWINHPGEELPGGEGRPSYWAGNGVLPRVMQHEKNSFLLFDLGESPRLPYTHLHLPIETLDQVVIQDNWCFVRSGNGYGAFHASNGVELVESGPARGNELRSYGEQCGWFVAVDSGNGKEGFESFVAQFRDVEMQIEQPPLAVAINVPESGLFEFDWNGRFTLNGNSAEFPESVGPEPVIRIFKS